MEKKMGPFNGVYGDIIPLTENQMEKSMENESGLHRSVLRA